MKITGEQLRDVVLDNKHRTFSIESRIATERLLWFTYDVLRKIGEKETAAKIEELINAIDSLDTRDIMKLKIWD